MGELDNPITSKRFEIKIDGKTVKTEGGIKEFPPCITKENANFNSNGVNISFNVKSMNGTKGEQCELGPDGNFHLKKKIPRPYREESMHQEWNEGKGGLKVNFSDFGKDKKKKHRSSAKRLVGINESDCMNNYGQAPINLDGFYSPNFGDKNGNTTDTGF